jgi:circadian clock protein KaiB
MYWVEDGPDAMLTLAAASRVPVTLPAPNRTATFRFRLYVAGDAPNSRLARANLHAICSAYGADEVEIEEVDVLREPSRALADRVRMTPTLIEIAPAPGVRIVGPLVDWRRVRLTLGLPDPGR